MAASVGMLACGQTTKSKLPAGADATATTAGGEQPTITAGTGGSDDSSTAGVMAGDAPGTGGLGSAAGGPAGGAAGAGSGGATLGCRTRTDCPLQGFICKEGLCFCPQDKPEICGTGAQAACVDRSSDPEHCGQCGVPCDAGAACVAGKCGAKPADLVTATGCGGGIRMAFGGSNLYWTERNSGKVRSVAVAGGAIVDVATGQLTPTQIVTDAAAVYWANQGDAAVGSSRIMMRLVAAGSPAPQAIKLASGTDKLPALAIGGDKLYYALKNDVHQMSTNGAGDIVVGTSVNYDIPNNPIVSGEPLGIAVNGSRVVFSTPGTRQSVESHRLTEITVLQGDTGHALLGKGLGALLASGDVASDAAYAYWVDGYKIQRNQVDATEPLPQVVTFAPGAGTITAFVVTDTLVFAALDDGRIFKHSLTPPADPENDPSPPELIARDQLGVTSMVADAANVFWVTTDCIIRSTAL